MVITNKKIIELIQIYGSNCFMGYKVSRYNPYTFHHIRKSCKGGKFEVFNGALLTREAHNDLNAMENNKKCKCLYRDLNLLFKQLNKTHDVPSIEYYKEIRAILSIASKYIELSEYYDPCNIVISGLDDYVFEGNLLIPKRK